MKRFHFLSLSLVLVVLSACRFFPEKNVPPTPTPTPTADVDAPGAASTTNALWRESAARCDKGSCQLKVTLVVRRQPGIGDMDSIFYDLSRATKDKSAILTVEPLTTASSAEFTPILHKVPVADMDKGKTYDFVLPKSERPLQFGIFLCKDAKAVGRCLEKPAVDLGRIMVIDAMHLKQDRNFQSPDLIYYFQYGLLDGNTVATFPGMMMEDLGDEVFAARLARVENAYPKDLRIIVQKEMATAKRLSRTMRSMPVEHASPGLRAVLLGSERAK